MHKFFLSFNEFRKKLIKKYKDIPVADITDEQTKVDYLNYLLASFGEIFHIKRSFDTDSFFNSLKNWLETDQKIKIEEQELGDIKIFALANTSKIKKFLGLNKTVFMAIGVFDTILSFYFLPYDWLENPTIDKKNEKNSFLQNIFVDNIAKYILQYITSSFSETELNYASSDNYLVSGLDAHKQQFVLSELQPEEVLLGWQKAGTMKLMAGNKDFYKKLSWYYLLTSNDSMLVGFDNTRVVVEAFDLHNREMSVGGLRPVVEVSEYQWNISVSSVSKYKKLAEVATLTAKERIKNIAIVNFKESGNSFKYFDFAEFLLRISKSETAELSIFLLDYIRDSEKAKEEYTKNEKLKTILEKIIEHPQAEELLVYWYKDWQPPLDQALLIKKMFDEIADGDMLLEKKTLPLHKLVYEDAIANEKDDIKKILLDIDYCNHLINVGNSKEAEKILKKDLKKLPDISLADLLPADDVDITGKASGQIIKVMIYDLLAKASKEKKAVEYKQKAAVLQPLNPERLNILIEDKNAQVAQKAEIILKICTEQDLEPIEKAHEEKYLRLSGKIKDRIIHPALKNKKTSTSITKFIASQSMPDIESIKDYAEAFDARKYPLLASIVADLQAFFTFQNIEIYIAHGEKSVGIQAYDGNPPFLTIGNDHLDIDSPFFLTYNELKFALAVEFAFIEYKFAKLTGSDLWRGAMNTGLEIAETLLAIVPVLGVVKNILQVNALANIVEKYKLLEKTKSAEKIAKSSQEILLTASETLGIMKKTFDKKDKNSADKIENFLAISRIMQISADRTALILTNDITSAVRSVFLTSKDLYLQLEMVKKYGLNRFLLQKDEKGKFLRENLSVRFASMFSFYLSEDFEKIRNSIIEINSKQ